MSKITIKDYLKTKTENIFELFQEDIKTKFDVTVKNTYAFLEGNNPICLVAHIDTMRKESENSELKIIESNGVLRAENSILGADDRAGVYSIAQIYKKSKTKPSILLTNLEEAGGIGVKLFCTDYKQLPFKTNLFIELDRRGSNDYVTYNIIHDKVKEYIESFGFKENYGSYSDIKDLTDSYSIPSVNLSIGYFNEHLIEEHLVLDIMESTIKRVLRILENPIDKLWICKSSKFKKLKRRTYGLLERKWGGIEEEEEEEEWFYERYRLF